MARANSKKQPVTTLHHKSTHGMVCKGLQCQEENHGQLLTHSGDNRKIKDVRKTVPSN